MQARVAMQSKYIRDYQDLYEDFHITQLPLQPGEVRGADGLAQFSKLLVERYNPQQPEESGEVA